MGRIKKLLILVLAIFLCLLPVAIYAASIGGAETQSKEKVGVSVDQEFVFGRDLKHQSGLEGVGSGIEIKNMSRTMAKISYGLLDNLDIYTKLGTADVKIKGPGFTAKTSNAFAWAIGAKGTYEFAEDWLLGADIQYLRHKHSANFNFNEVGWDGKIVFQEWQVAPYVAKKIGNFTPYLGVKYSDLRTRGAVKLKADDNFGMFTGLSYKINDRLFLNTEYRFVDETAMSVAAVYRF